MKIKEILEKGNKILKESNIEDSHLKVKILLSHILNVDKGYLVIKSDENIDKIRVENFFEYVNRLSKNEPIQYITNSQEFFGLNFYVDKNVLIPQPDTEILVEEVIQIAKTKEKPLKILDLCTGSGAIAISLSKNLKNVEITASDISEDALEVAKKNSIKNECEIRFVKSNLFENINDKFDIIVSNPPYIKTDVINTLSEEVKNEPLLALDGKEDGLYFYKNITEKAKEFLNEDGVLAFEIGYDQKDEVMKILETNSFVKIYSKKDLSRNDRIVVGNKN